MIIVIYLALLAAAFFFLIVRPQRRRAVYQRQLQSTIEVGDEVVTNGGVIGVVTELGAETAHVEIAPGVVVRFARAALAAKTNPLAQGDDDAPDDEDHDD